MPKPEQVGQQLDDAYDKFKVLRELDTLHRRINELLVDPIWTDVEADLKTGYEVGELDTEAKIVAAFNTSNAKINAVANAMNAVFAKIRRTT